MGKTLNLPVVNLINLLYSRLIKHYTAVEMNELQLCDTMDNSQEHSLVG